MSDAIPALERWCRDLERVYREEALPLRGPLVDDTILLIDRLEQIVHTGSGVASMRTDAQRGPEFAAIAIMGLHHGGLCNGHGRTALITVG